MRRLLTDLIDFDRLRSQKEIQLTVCATNARTARRRVFTDNDLSVEALLASACQPQLFGAVDIDGEPYWDGALTGNPALGPLLTKRPDCDLIIVRVDPVNRPEAPRSQRDILNRTVEISHNSTFWLELGAIAVVLRFVDEARSPSGRKAIRIPVSAGPAQMIAAAVEFIANHATHRPSKATVEGVRIASWSKPLSIEKSRRELGYAPRPIGPALERAISSFTIRSR